MPVTIAAVIGVIALLRLMAMQRVRARQRRVLAFLSLVEDAYSDDQPAAPPPDPEPIRAPAAPVDVVPEPQLSEVAVRRL